MDLRKEDLPATLQAFELNDDHEIFIAEQVVNSQAEIETFTTRYTGKLIKAKKVPVVVTENNKVDGYGSAVYKQPRSSTGLVMVIIILIILVLVIYGFSTGWIQDKLHLKI